MTANSGDTAKAGARAKPVARPAEPASWHQRYGELFEELRRPALAMIRRAFGNAFGRDEIEDLYGNAWLGTLRALERRKDELSDGELRKYILTAVANQASKELRRRGRRPTAPLDMARGVADDAAPPEERATRREESQIARDVLGTLPPRRRAVLMFRYGWGLEPSEVCGLVAGLSHRAYRKEITRGVDEVSSKLRLVEEGRWCGSREPILKAYATGLADEDERRQAEHHLAHCRPCAEYVGKLHEHLHEIGSAVAWTTAASALDGDRSSLGDRLGEMADRARESTLGVLNRGGGEPSEPVAQVAAAGGARGAGAGAAGGIAKLAGAGAVPKLIATCLGTGAAATACIAAGIGPVHLPETTGRAEVQRDTGERQGSNVVAPSPQMLPSQVGHETPRPPDPSGGVPEDVGTEQTSTVAPPAEVAPAPAPPVQQEFGLAPAPAAGAASSSPTPTGGGATDGSSGAVSREFGP